MTIRAIKRDSQHSVLRDSYTQPLITNQVMVVHVSVASSKPKVESDSYADKCVIGDNCLVNHKHNRPCNVYSYDSKNGHRSAKAVDGVVDYQDTQSGEKFILMMNHAIHINGFVYHLLCPMQCCLNGVYISKVPKFLAKTPNETTHALESINPFDPTIPLIISLQLSGVTRFFDVFPQ